MIRYELVNAYTGDVLAYEDATCPADALAHYSIYEGFADPREIAAGRQEPLFPNTGEDDYFYRPNQWTVAQGLWHGGPLGMTFTNFAIEARVAPAISGS